VDWEAAQAALEAARLLPVGAERFEALKKAGRLRYEACKKRTSGSRSGAATNSLDLGDRESER
jgi:hypothetical protein